MAQTKVKNWGRPHRLKKEALKFFKEDLSTKVMSVTDWKERYNIDENALEELTMPVITYGIKDGNDCTSLSGWSNPENKECHSNKLEGSHYCFTIHFESMKYEEHDRFSKGRVMRDFMERLQNEADRYFQQFVEGKTNNE